jgi:hypothetical protein
MIERYIRVQPASGALYAVTTTDGQIVVTDNRAVAIIAQDPGAATPFLAFTPIGRLRPYTHCLRRFVLGAYLAGGGYDALAQTYGSNRRVTRDWLECVIDVVGDAEARRMLRQRSRQVTAKRAFDSLLTSINQVGTYATAGNGVNGVPVPWCAAVIAAVACRIVANRRPASLPQVTGFTISLDPQGELL